MGSIWCPRSLGGSSCPISVESDGTAFVEVPESVLLSAQCHAFKPEANASCTEEYSDEALGLTSRFDQGGYPFGYYQFQHLFVGEDVYMSVVWMRLGNIALGIGGVAGATALSSSWMRRNILVSALVAWVPMGVYYISSINPSSWAITGVFLYAVGVISALNRLDWRRWCLLAIAALGALMAMVSRGDSAFYILVVSLAMWFVLPFTKTRRPELVFTAVASVLGILALLSTGQAGQMTSDGGWPTDMDLSYLTLLKLNLVAIPEFVAGLWGLNWGPGWFDVPLSGWTTIVMLVVAGGVFLIAAGDLYPRKVLAALVLAGAIVGIPVVNMVVRHVRFLYLYQPRYLLPLLGVLVLVWLLSRQRRSYFGFGPRLWIIVAMVSVANLFALERVQKRYIFGYNGVASDALTISRGIGWWPWPIPHEIVLWGGSAAFALGMVALFVSISNERLASLVETGNDR